MSCALWLVQREVCCVEYAACLLCIVVNRNHCFLCCAARCVDQSSTFITDVALRKYGMDVPHYACSKAKRDGQCGAATGKQFCPVTCDLCGALPPFFFGACRLLSTACSCRCCAEKPNEKGAFLVTPQFCVSNRQSCKETSICGRYISSVEDCKKALAQLPLVRNMSRTILTLNDHRAPKGCLLDAELEAYFNAGGTSESNYGGLMSVCLIRAKKGDSNTPPTIFLNSDTHMALQTCTRCQFPSKKLWKHAVRTSHC